MVNLLYCIIIHIINQVSFVKYYVSKIDPVLEEPRLGPRSFSHEECGILDRMSIARLPDKELNGTVLFD